MRNRINPFTTTEVRRASTDAQIDGWTRKAGQKQRKSRRGK
jgi:hypothetical protein